MCCLVSTRRLSTEWTLLLPDTWAVMIERLWRFKSIFIVFGPLPGVLSESEWKIKSIYQSFYFIYTEFIEGVRRKKWKACVHGKKNHNSPIICIPKSYSKWHCPNRNRKSFWFYSIGQNSSHLPTKYFSVELCKIHHKNVL